MIKTFSCALGLTLALSAWSPAMAQSFCGKAQQKIQEARALFFQAEQEARRARRDTACDTFDKVIDRYEEAREEFEECRHPVAAINLRSPLRHVNDAKRFHRC